MTSLHIKSGDYINYAKFTKVVFLSIYVGMILSIAVAFFG